MRLALITSLIALSACTTYEVIDHSRGELSPPDASSDTPSPDAEVDSGSDDAPDASDDVERGLPSRLVIDSSVHTGTYANGTNYEGIYGEVVTYELSALPEDAPLALLHVELLAEKAGLALDARDAITHVLLRGRIDCGNRGVTGGCFMLLDDPHLRELRDYDPERFTDIDQAALTQGSFGLGAMALVWRAAYDEAIYGQYVDSTDAFFAGLPSPGERARYNFFSYVYSAYQDVLVDAFEQCAETSLYACLLELPRANPSQHDLIDAHANIDAALAEVPQAEIYIPKPVARAYLEGIGRFRVTDGSWIPSVLQRAYGANDALTTYDEAREMLQAATNAVGAPPTPAAIRTVLCARSVLRGPPACE